MSFCIHTFCHLFTSSLRIDWLCRRLRISDYRQGRWQGFVRVQQGPTLSRRHWSINDNRHQVRDHARRRFARPASKCAHGYIQVFFRGVLHWIDANPDCGSYRTCHPLSPCPPMYRLPPCSSMHPLSPCPPTAVSTRISDTSDPYRYVFSRQNIYLVYRVCMAYRSCCRVGAG